MILNNDPGDENDFYEKLLSRSAVSKENIKRDNDMQEKDDINGMIISNEKIDGTWSHLKNGIQNKAA